MSDDDEMINEEIARLVDAGALVISGMNGEEFTYNMVPDVLKVENPELYALMMAEVNEALLKLYEEGLVNVEYDESLKPRFSVTDDGMKLAEEMLRDGQP